MGVSSCDICPDGLMKICHDAQMKGGPGLREHWKMVDELGIDLLFPCAHGHQCYYNNYMNQWADRMVMYYYRNQELTDEIKHRRTAAHHGVSQRSKSL